ncbi:MAG TPA: hypothetical protein VKX16_06850 [Chloroflexota bacterium]|nr:hypothetical protein [Chloroflexota bacterium]
MTAHRVSNLAARERARIRLEAIDLRAEDDEISLLRKARLLKTVSADLHLAASRAAGSGAVGETAGRLQEMERCLKSVLLADGGLPRDDLQRLVGHALEQARRAVHVVECPEPARLP